MTDDETSGDKIQGEEKSDGIKITTTAMRKASMDKSDQCEE